MDTLFNCNLAAIVSADRLRLGPRDDPEFAFEAYTKHFAEMTAQTLEAAFHNPVTSTQMIAGTLTVTALSASNVKVALAYRPQPHDLLFTATLEARVIGPDPQASAILNRLMAIRDSLL